MNRQDPGPLRSGAPSAPGVDAAASPRAAASAAKQSPIQASRASQRAYSQFVLRAAGGTSVGATPGPHPDGEVHGQAASPDLPGPRGVRARGGPRTPPRPRAPPRWPPGHPGAWVAGGGRGLRPGRRDRRAPRWSGAWPPPATAAVGDVAALGEEHERVLWPGGAGEAGDGLGDHLATVARWGRTRWAPGSGSRRWPARTG